MGSRYTVTVSTGTSTKLMGLWHEAPTETVISPTSEESSITTTPVSSTCSMIAVEMSLPITTFAPTSGSPVKLSYASTRRLPSSA
jgi:hypothetical protein